MCSASATPRGWKPIRSPTCCSANTARNGTSSRPTTPSATRCINACTDDLKKLGGTVTGNELTPLGTTDFSAYLIKARAANPDVLILLVQGSDMINCLKQVVQFGLNKQIHVAGTQQELESLAALPPEARIGVWMFEWYWKQPGVPGVEKFVADIRKVNNGNVPTARHWFGYTSAMTFALVANREKTIDAVKLAAALENFELPDDVKLQPNKVLLPQGRSSADDIGLRRRGAVEGQGRPGRSVPCRRGRAGRQDRACRRAKPAAPCSGRPNDEGQPFP